MDNLLYLLVAVAALASWDGVVGGRGIGGPKCTFTREFGMQAANCFSLDLEQIPTTLLKNIEVLYAAKNRIRSLTNSSFQDYTSLRLLYLGDNFITKMEPGVFSELSDLEVLDLSRNAVRSLPTDLPLPLRKLYLADNIEIQNVTLTAAFNLAFLTMADCDLKQFPYLGVLPNLKVLNLTGNPMTSVTPADLAPLCRLETVYLPQSLYRPTSPLTPCQCHQLLTWTSQHYIGLPAFNCTPLQEDPDSVACDMDFSEERKVHSACLLATPASSTRYLLVAVLAGSLLLAAIIVVCWWRKSRRKKNSVQDQKRTDKNAKAADTLIM